MPQLHIKRIYEKPDGKDGFRILIDGLWPRGIRKDSAKVDLWLKDIAPSTNLRKWFNHEPGKWPEFHKLYYKELSLNPKPVEQLIDVLKKRDVTLLYGAKNEQFNNAVALKSFIQESAPKNPH